MDNTTQEFCSSAITEHPDFKKKYPVSCFYQELDNVFSNSKLGLSNEEIDELKKYSWINFITYIGRCKIFGDVESPSYALPQKLNYGGRQEEEEKLQKIYEALNTLTIQSKTIPEFVLCGIEASAKVLETQQSEHHNIKPEFFNSIKLEFLRNATKKLIDRRKNAPNKTITKPKEIEAHARDGFIEIFALDLIRITKISPKTGHSYNSDLENTIKKLFEVYCAYGIPLTKYETESGNATPLRTKVRSLMLDTWNRMSSTL